MADGMPSGRNCRVAAILRALSADMAGPPPVQYRPGGSGGHSLILSDHCLFLQRQRGAVSELAHARVSYLQSLKPPSFAKPWH
ncbi:hypothetical protein AWB81_04900 [Caballeronia arationis]|jgi:hypothetical protein|uniref:Uncharacterized protein n=1 Tax=Caballeronia arationis TaxID=1777142 RepID=A0A7Z7N1K5_9BURK|nr:hypothetical protein AWB81_04900 [Caballeronia arationis]SOE60324.1 hypothetical protein SAMN05446927_1914 [Caballeronia arationis]